MWVYCNAMSFTLLHCTVLWCYVPEWTCDPYKGSVTHLGTVSIVLSVSGVQGALNGFSKTLVEGPSSFAAAVAAPAKTPETVRIDPVRNSTVSHVPERLQSAKVTFTFTVSVHHESTRDMTH